MDGLKVLHSRWAIILGIFLVAISILVSMLMFSAVFAEDNVAREEKDEVAEELVLKEEDFNSKAYEYSLYKLNRYFEEWKKQDSYSESAQAVILKVDWAMLNIGIPNHFLVLKGYGLTSREEILSLKLANARLKKASRETIAGLEQQIKDINNQINVFLSENYWTD